MRGADPDGGGAVLALLLPPDAGCGDAVSCDTGSAVFPPPRRGAAERIGPLLRPFAVSLNREGNMNGHRNIRGATGAAITAVLALGTIQGCGSALGAASAPEAPDVPSATTQCVGKQPVGSLPGHMEETPVYRVLGYVLTAEARYSAVFTGLSVDDAHQAADVYRIPSKAFDADVCGAAVKGVTVRLHDTDVTKVELDALAARISADMKRWDGTFDLRGVGVDSSGFVLVGVDDPAKAEPLITEAFGKEHIRIEHADQAELVHLRTTMG
jgi:hypothetical protein